MFLVRTLFLVAAIFVVPATTLAQAQTSPCEGERHRQFDFWLGSWEVFNADGRLLGTNEITSEEDGCVLIERWRSENGSGMSINYVDPSTSTWKQHWVAAGGYVIELEGGLVDSALVMEGSIIQRDGLTKPMRGTWTPLDDGRVRQQFHTADSTGAWSSWFDGYYQRVE